MEGQAGKDPDLGSSLNILAKLGEEEREKVSQKMTLNFVLFLHSYAATYKHANFILLLL